MQSRIRMMVPLLFLALTVALLGCEGPEGPAGPDGTDGTDGMDGVDGVECWDSNGDGVEDAAEDVNGDGAWDALDCTGDTGLDGIDGIDGVECWDLNGDGVDDAGEDVNGDGAWDALDCAGADVTLVAPEATYFAVAVTDNSGTDAKGATGIMYDAAGDSMSTTPYTVVPGEMAWGIATTVPLPTLMNAGNAATEITIRAMYDHYYAYFEFSWVDPTATESIAKKLWTYDSGTTSWAQTGNEDRLYAFWDIDTPGWTGDCAASCHVGDGHATSNPGDRLDIWHWKAARTNPVGFADDKWMGFVDAGVVALGDGRHGDWGSSSYSDNEDATGTEPGYQFLGDPGSTYAGDFLFDWISEAFVPAAAWANGDTIPGYLLTYPEGSRADLFADGIYDTVTDTWTVTVWRLRKTGHGDDHEF